jgi:hypothetical protein
MTYPGTKIREHTALESGLIQRVTELEKERDELVKALRPFAKYAEMRAAQPLNGLDMIVHSIHTGTQWAAEITLGDCQRARRLLLKYK